MKLPHRFRRAAATLAAASRHAIPGALRDLTGIGGITAMSYGAWQVYPPAGWIVGGALTLWIAVALGRKAPLPESERD